MKFTSLFFLSFLLLQHVVSQVLLPIEKIRNDINYGKLCSVDTVLKHYIDKNQLVGAVVIVVKDNEIVYYKGHGYSNLALKKPMDNNAIFRIMSQTKAITSVAIMQLFEQGKLRLDQNISDFIPEFKNPRIIMRFNQTDSSYTSVPAKREITFRDLLTHTSGIDYALIGSDSMRAIYAKAGVPSGLGYIHENLLAK